MRECSEAIKTEPLKSLPWLLHQYPEIYSLIISAYLKLTEY
jgi:hypothetical protein